MSELLAQAAAALNAPEAIVKRSAEARARAGGISTDEVLAAWAGGGSPATAVPAATAAPTAASAPTPTDQPAAAEPAQPAATEPGGQEAPVAAATAVPASAVAIAEPLVVEEIEIHEPVPLGERIKSAGRIGAWTGSLLGLLGALVASTWLLTAASLDGTEGDFNPSVLVTGSRFVLATALMSVVFGLIVATLSRALTGWLRPGAALGGRVGVTRLIGAATGLVLGLAAGSVLTSAFGQPVEGTEGLVSLPVLSALIVVLIGGAALGWITAALVQVVGVPASLTVGESHEVDAVRSRLGSAIAVPVAGIIALFVLVVPFAFVLIRSNHMASGGAAMLAIIVSASILGIAGMAASRPGMKIRRGEFVVALGGIGVVILIIVAVFLARSEGEHVEEEAPPAEASAFAFVLERM
jgi:MFS family permease